MNVTNETLFKATGTNATPCHGGRGKWHKPHSQKRPGKWMPLIKDIYPCRKGYHVCEGEQVLKWINKELYEVEIRGEQIKQENKIVAQQARLVRRITTWNDRTARLFACDCAEHVLHIFEEKYPEDKRPRKAIKVARAYINKKATKEELSKARIDAAAVAADAYAAAVNAVRNAAAAASHAADASYAAVNAVRNAAASYAAAVAASYAAGADAAYEKERKWQYKQLLKYLNGELS